MITLTKALAKARSKKRDGYDGHEILREINSIGASVSINGTLAVLSFPDSVLVVDHTGDSFAVEGKFLA